MTDLYRVFDSAGRLLYVGVTVGLHRRMSQHRNKSPWFPQADRLLVEQGLSRRDACLAESAAIRTELPLWNIQGSPQREAAEQLVAPAGPRHDAIQMRSADAVQAALADAEQHILRSLALDDRLFALLRNAEYRLPAPAGRRDEAA